jgi:3-hydroxybutyryl-CoA dehydratase
VSLLPFQTLYFEDLSLGMTEAYSKTVKSSDVVGFAELSGDRNPIHLSEHFASRTLFRGRIAHGLYTASLISAVIGTRLPGPGAIYLSQTLEFRAPVKIGDTVTATVQVVELIERGRKAKLKCQCIVADTVVLEGEAMVKVLQHEPRLPYCNRAVHDIVGSPRIGALVRREPAATSSDQIPEILDRTDEDKRFQCSEPIPVQLEAEQCCIRRHARHKSLEDPCVGPFPCLVLGCRDVEALSEIGQRSAKAEVHGKAWHRGACGDCL